MNMIVCLDDKDGMLFNRRRQSADAAVCSRILEIAEGKPLFMNGYSAKLFADIDKIHIREDFLDKMESDDWAFVENCDVLPYLQSVKTLVIFRWNRIYPRDMVFPMAQLSSHFRKQETAKFPGASHDVITEERYIL